MEPQTKTISVKHIPLDLWDAVRIGAIAAKQSIPQFVVEALRKATNGKGK
jgi:hypothetical protein